MKVLVVDDSTDMRMIVVSYLKSVGSKVKDLDIEVASDGMSGFELWKQWQPDLVITDFDMPGLNGEEFAHQIREIETQQKTHIVLLSGTERYPQPNLFNDILVKADSQLVEKFGVVLGKVSSLQ